MPCLKREKKRFVEIEPPPALLISGCRVIPSLEIQGVPPITGLKFSRAVGGWVGVLYTRQMILGDAREGARSLRLL